MTNALSEKKVIEALSKVADLAGRGDLVSRGRVQAVEIEGAAVKVVLHLPTEDRSEKFRIEDQARDAVGSVPGVEDVTIVTRGARTHGQGPAPKQETAKADLRSPFELQASIAGVDNIVAVASGKGGVGKSTVCVNLAIALARMGNRVGLLDIDVYGPSLPVMLGIGERPQAGKQKEIAPLEREGMKLMSLGFLIDSGSPVIWRGPLVIQVVRKFLHDVEWGRLDYLMVDLPPGTGDAQLTLVQTVPLTGAVIVTTPSNLALVDAEKGLKMFQQVKVPVIGLVENMSFFICPHCGRRSDVFSSGGARKVAERLGAPYLGEIPLDPEVRSRGDGGRPIALAGEDSQRAKPFFALARRVVESCSGRGQ